MLLFKERWLAKRQLIIKTPEWSTNPKIWEEEHKTTAWLQRKQIRCRYWKRIGWLLLVDLRRAWFVSKNMRFWRLDILCKNRAFLGHSTSASTHGGKVLQPGRGRKHSHRCARASSWITALRQSHSKIAGIFKMGKLTPLFLWQRLNLQNCRKQGFWPENKLCWELFNPLGDSITQDINPETVQNLITKIPRFPSSCVSPWGFEPPSPPRGGFGDTRLSDLAAHGIRSIKAGLELGWTAEVAKS